MDGWKRILCFAALGAVAAISVAQQSAGRFGQSSGGGSAAPFEGPTSPEKKPAADLWSPTDWALWKTATAVASSEGVKYRLQLRKQDVILARCSSQAFDPKLTVLDESGKVLATNNDRATGLQDSFVIAEIPSDGSYSLQVGVQGSGSGQFEIKYCIGRLANVAFGKKTIVPPPDERGIISATIFAKLKLEKDQVYSLGRSIEAGAVCLIGPSMTPTLDYEILDESNDSIIRAHQTSTYYLASAGVVDFDNFNPVPIKTVVAGSSTPIDLAAGEAVLLQYPVNKGQIRRLKYPLKLARYSKLKPLREPELIPNLDSDTPTPTLGQVSAGPNEFVCFFSEDGFTEVLLHAEYEPVKGTVSWTDDIPVWRPGVLEENSIKVGESRFFVATAQKSDLMKVFVKATAFVPTLAIYDMEGTPQNLLGRKGELTAEDDLFFPHGGTYVFRVAGYEDAGSGTFQMKRNVPVAIPLELGKSVTLNLQEATFGLYSLNLEANERYEVRVEPSQPGFTEVDVLPQLGWFLRSQKVRLGQTAIDYFQIPEAGGPARLWIRGSPGERKITVRKFEP